MKLFLSYCHSDEKHLKNFRTHLAPLKQNRVISDWHDREIPTGENINEKINENLESADIIALLISHDFLASENCQKELETAFALKAAKNTDILPIIISKCDWQDVTVGEDSTLKDFLVCPTDAKAIEDWTKSNAAWMDVVSHLKKMISKQIMRDKKPTKKFESFMENPGGFVSNNRDDILNLKDLYTYPMLKILSASDKNETAEPKDASLLIQKKSLDGQSFLILGDDFSGKTALCQMLCYEFIRTPFFPVYIDGKNIRNDNINQIEKEAFEHQYEHLHHNHPSDKNKIIIFDNFANENIKEFEIFSLLSKIKKKQYGMVIMVGNTMNPLFATLQWDNVATRNNIDTYDILHTNYKMCRKIIHNWIKATHEDKDIENIEVLENQYMDFIRTIFVENIMSLYAPHIIMILDAQSGNRALSDSSDEPSSYGHCYSALITHALLKTGIPMKDIGGYKNILIELAYYMYTENKATIATNDTAKFRKIFENKYMELPNNFMKVLLTSKLLTQNLYEDISMKEYVFYYYVAKRLSVDFSNSKLIDEAKEKIEELLSGVHRKRNGHILLFLIHHMPRNDYLLDKINNELNVLFKIYPEAELTTAQLAPLQKYIDTLPTNKLMEFSSAEQREESKNTHLQQTEIGDELDSSISQRDENNDSGENTRLIEMGKSFRMMKIAGSLLKTEYKTMERNSLIQLSKSTRGLAFRILFCSHKALEEHTEVWEFLLENIIFKKRWENLLPYQKKEELTAAIGSLAAHLAHSMITRCSWCIGSEKLTALISSDDSCPSYQLLDLSTYLWYGKKLDGKKLDIKRIMSLYEKFKKDNIMSARLLEKIVIVYLHIHETDIKQRQQLAEHLNINYKSQNLIEHRRKRDN